MHYEFLLYAISKGRRFAKWGKPENDDNIKLIMEVYTYSYDKAREVLDLFSDADIERLRSLKDTGGVAQAAARKKAK